MSDPVASVEIQARSTGLAARLREIRAKFGTFADGIATKLKGAMANKKGSMWGKGSFLGDASRHAAGNLAATAIGGVTSLLVDGARGILSFEEKLTRLQIQANETPESMRAFARSVTTASNATGVGREKILDGATAFVTLTGRMDIARDSAAVFAKVAQATGSSVEDIGTTAAAAFQNMGIGAKDFEQFFSGMTAQGKAGAVELKDLASRMSTIAPQWAQFAGGKGLKGARDLGAALQVVKRGFGGDAGETVTGLQQFLISITKNSKRFADAGVGSFFDVSKVGGKTTKTMKGVFDIVNLISKSKLVRDPEALTKALGSSEAYRAFIQLSQGRKDIEGFVEAAEDGTVIQKDFDTYMQSSAGKMAQAWEQVKNKIADAATPERIEAFTNAVVKLADALTTVVGVADSLLSSLDVEGALAEKIKTDRMARAANMTPQEKAKLADELEREAANVQGDDAGAIGGRRGLMDAAKEIRKSASAADSWIGQTGAADPMQAMIARAQLFTKGGGIGGFAQNVLGEAAGGVRGTVAGIVPGGDPMLAKILAELQKIAASSAAGTTVKVDSEPIAKAAKNAPSHRGKVNRN